MLAGPQLGPHGLHARRRPRNRALAGVPVEDRPTLQPHPTFDGQPMIPAEGMCPGCGQRDQAMHEMTRHFHCPHCGLIHDDRKEDRL